MDLEEAISIRKEEVITPAPLNTVLLSQRLWAESPKIDMIPCVGEDAQRQEDTEAVERWLQAMWERTNWLQRRDVMHELKSQSLIRGRHAVEVKWISQEVPLSRRSDFPILIRPLDPMNVGFHMGPYYMEYIYNTYQQSLLDTQQVYGEQLSKVSRNSELGRKMWDVSSGPDGWKHEDTQVKMVDFWYVNPKDGTIWNAVLCEDEFLVEPFETTYPDLPIITGRGDHAIYMEDEYDGLSILHGIDGLWQFECRMYSLLATGLLWYFWPGILITNESGYQPEDLDIGPGIIETAAAGTQVQMVQIDPNVPLAQTMQQSVQLMMQQSTYPEVLYGKSPGEVQAGYAVSMLGDAARGRIHNFSVGLEATIEAVNQQVLAYVEMYGQDENGVSIMHFDEVEGTKEILTLKPEMIQGNFQNKVSLRLVVPQDEQAKHAAGMRLAEVNAISFETLRDRFVGIDMPTEEQKKVFLEEAMMSDEFRPIRMRKAIIEEFGIEDGMPMLAEMGLLPPAPSGFTWNQAGQLEMQGQQAPMPTQGPPPGAMPGPPGAMPEGGAPPGAMAGEGAPPGMAAMMSGPMGGGVPPQVQGQPTPADMGMTPQENPALFQEVAGQTPLTPEEEARLAAEGATGR